MFSSCFFMVHYACYQYNETKLTEGSRLFCHFSRPLSCTSNLGLITPHLFNLLVRFTIIFPALWSSVVSNSPMSRCFIITVRNWMMTLEHGLIRTWHLLLFSVLWILLRPSAKDTHAHHYGSMERWQKGKKY